MDPWTAILVSILTAATPLVLAGLGELVVERSGVLNLGVEGMMLAGAVAGFATALSTESATLAVVAAAAAGAGLSLLFALVAIGLLANQVASGLALTIFGVGLSALFGSAYIGVPVERLPRLELAGLSDLPLLGPLLFGHDALIYLALALVPLTSWFLSRTHAGMVLRACGENAEAAHALGYPVRTVRALAVLYGGALAGLAGGYLSLAYTPMWAEEMTAGRGWIALALVVFSSWRPWRLLLGAWLFGGVGILQLHAQSLGLVAVPSQLLSMLPYLATILVLTVVTAGPWRGRLAAPACLGQPFLPPR
jgi:simple sugar transport system permease protein